MEKETSNWGISVVRTELKEIDPPKDVQETMNKVVKAENEKIAAIDFATATETMADGQKRAEIKKAEGIKQADILKAEGQAKAIQLVNEAADKYFVGNAQLLRKLQTVEESLKNNSKIVLPENGELVISLAILGRPAFEEKKGLSDKCPAAKRLARINRIAPCGTGR